ncbi:MAG TPA: Gfo/Idh/MocA family oxidoreductase [Terriglobia bacterium]|nr:Gfo/Idh/MocA family oxidoreductase [Terriglobia bacterium]
MTPEEQASAGAGSEKLSRRKFIGTAAAAGAGFMILKPGLVRGTEANSAVRVGLLGCGGRGTEDATNLVDTGGARVVALADLFQDQLDKGHRHFDQHQQGKGYAALDASQLFLGPNAYEQIAGSKEVDAIVIATPPIFHPHHLETVVAAGKHVYCEKPVAVDVPGAKQVMDIGKRAEGKLSLDVGFQIRNCPPFVEMVKRIHGGALGTIASGEAHYIAGYIDRPDWPNASPDERRLRNWVHDRTLSGDIIVEQNIHAIDICNWVLQDHPVKAAATGGTEGRPPSDTAYSHYNVVLYYPNDIPVTFSSTQFNKGWWDVTERFFGTKGTSQSPYSGPIGIWGDEPWHPETEAQPQGSEQFSATGKFSDNLAQADPEKKKAFVESITSGQFHNQAEQGALSALTCMMARTAAYTGNPVTWEDLMGSTEVWESGLDLNKMNYRG